MSEQVHDLKEFKHRVSSTLNRAAEFASKHMFDGRDDTCWNSDQGSPQFIIFEFSCRVRLARVQLMFQGGFVGQDALIEMGDTPQDGTMTTVAVLQTIEDSNRLQSFDIGQLQAGRGGGEGGRYVKITFPSSTDFYGRVTLYQVALFGNLLP